MEDMGRIAGTEGHRMHGLPDWTDWDVGRIDVAEQRK
jgi:hypothetical protein